MSRGAGRGNEAATKNRKGALHHADSLVELFPASQPHRTSVVVSLCDLTGNMVRPWADAGYECWCVDTQHSLRNDRTEGNITYTWGDIRSWCPPARIRDRIGIVFAFPPCTHVAVSGARDFRKKRNVLLRDALELFAACEMVAAWSGAPYMIENPVGKFSDHMGLPNYTFQPWHFGDAWTKKTCLWTGNGFVMPLPRFAEPGDEVKPRIWMASPGPNRANVRSATPPGFAAAVFEANAALVKSREA